ncbi:MAG: hypothetical protein AAF960_09865 [Bacteroidota bacterium]
MKNVLVIFFAFATAFTSFANSTTGTLNDPTPVNITEDGGSQIDLIVKYIQKQKVVRVHGGYNVLLKVVVKNEGYYTLKRSFKVGFRFATSATQRPNEKIAYKLSLPYLGAKAAVTKHVCLFIPDSKLYGSNILGIQAIVDDSNASWYGKIYEANEKNNHSNVAICYLGGPS